MTTATERLGQLRAGQGPKSALRQYARGEERGLATGVPALYFFCSYPQKRWVSSWVDLGQSGQRSCAGDSEKTPSAVISRPEWRRESGSAQETVAFEILVSGKKDHAGPHKRPSRAQRALLRRKMVWRVGPPVRREPLYGAGSSEGPIAPR